MDWILDFCKNCTILLLQAEMEDGVCPNCGVSVRDRNTRLQGVFSEEDGRTFVAEASGDNHV